MRITNYNVKLTTKIPNGDIPTRCPLCGESRPYKLDISISKGKCDTERYGVEGIRYTWFKRFLFVLDLFKYEQEKYKCYTCGAKWKSKVKTEIVKENKKE